MESIIYDRDITLQERVNKALEEFGNNNVVFMTKHKILLSVIFGWLFISGLVVFLLLIKNLLYLQEIIRLDRVISIAYSSMYGGMILFLLYEVYKKTINHSVNDKPVIINDRFRSPFVKLNFVALLLSLFLSITEIFFLIKNSGDANVFLHGIFLGVFFASIVYLHSRIIRSYVKISGDYILITPELSEIGKWNNFFTQDVAAFNTNQIKAVTSMRDSWFASFFNYGTLHFRLESLKQTESTHIKYISCPRKIEHKILEISNTEEDDLHIS